MQHSQQAIRSCNILTVMHERLAQQHSSSSTSTLQQNRLLCCNLF
jgi:hypothetical protein